MSNFKSGSGNLDFGRDNDDEEPEPSKETAQPNERQQESDESTSQATPSVSKDSASSDPEDESIPAESDTESSTESSTETPSKDQYPYFIRRSNVGDERDTRLEIHVRDKVADKESAFRNELAEQLDVNEISKTDAREFALLAAYQHPERVAELMQEEGFGTF
jgi:cytoskeletal protein RodZ